MNLTRWGYDHAHQKRCSLHYIMNGKMIVLTHDYNESDENVHLTGDVDKS